MAFKHRPLTREQLERRLDQKQTQIIDPIFDPKYHVFRPKVGLNTVRFMPPTWENFQHWAFDVWIHRNVGPDNGTYLCLRRMLREPCPICEEVAQLDGAGDTEAGKQLYARKSRAAWIMDRADQEKGPQIWLYGWTIDEDIVGRCFNKKTGQEIDILHPDEGFDVSFRRGNEKPFPKTTQIEIDREPSPVDDDEKWQDHWLAFIEKNPIPDTLLYYDYDHLYRVLNGGGGKKASQHDDEVGTRSTTRRPPPPDDDPEGAEAQPATRRRPAPAEEEAEEQPRSTRRAPPPTEEEDPPPRASRRAPPPDEAAEEPEQPAPRRRTLPPDDDAPQGNGHDDNPTQQARRQLNNLRPEAEAEDNPPPRRRTPPPEDETPAPARRRAPPPT